MQIGIHPAPGFGELLPGWFVVPHNPITPASYVPSIGELLPAKFAVPENPIVRALMGDDGLQPKGSRRVSVAGLAGSCGCIAGSCGQGCAGLGMGQLGLESVGAFWPWILGGGVLLWMLSRPGGRGYRADIAKAESSYREAVSEARAKHRGYRRVVRSAAGAAKRGLEAATGERRAKRGTGLVPQGMVY